MKIWKTIGKAASALTAIVILVLFIGLVLSSNARSNFFVLGQSLLNAGPIGIVALFFILWNLRGTPSILLPMAFTNAIFVDAERDGAEWLKEWKEEQSRYKLVVNRLKTKNLVLWDPNKEA